MSYIDKNILIFAVFQIIKYSLCDSNIMFVVEKQAYFGVTIPKVSILSIFLIKPHLILNIHETLSGLASELYILHLIVFHFNRIVTCVNLASNIGKLSKKRIIFKLSASYE
jgi:hypothetical protein